MPVGTTRACGTCVVPMQLYWLSRYVAMDWNGSLVFFMTVLNHGVHFSLDSDSFFVLFSECFYSLQPSKRGPSGLKKWTNHHCSEASLLNTMQ